MEGALITLLVGVAIMCWPMIIFGMAASDPAPSLWFRPMQMLVIFVIGIVVAVSGAIGLVGEIWT